MRIDHVTPHFHPDVGGVETHVLRLSEFLVRQGHRVTVHTSRRSAAGRPLPAEEEFGGIRIRRYPSAVRLGYYMTLFRPRIESTDLLHVHGYGLLANDWSVRRYASVPSVYSLHHGVARAAPSPFAGARKAAYDRVLGLPTLRRTARALCASEADRAWLASRGFPADRLEVVPSGLDDDALQLGDTARGRARAGADRYLLYVGRLHREKSLDDLLRAFAELTERDIRLVVAGPDAGALRGLVALEARLGLGDRVEFTGEVDEPTKRDLLAGCEALVLPSSYEAQGIVLLEAWAQNRPVVASRVGGVPYLVREGADGLMFTWGRTDELRARLEAILADPAAAARMGRAGREKVLADFTWDKIANRIMGLYEGIAEGRDGPRA